MDNLLTAAMLMNEQVVWGLCNMDILRAQEDRMRNCPSIEYNQDMNAMIGYCQLDGQVCNCQCMRR